MLSQRYACPFFVLDDFIRLEQLHDFVIQFLTTDQEEKMEQYRWEYYLHKVFDKTYAEYLDMLEHNEECEPSMDEEQIRNVVDESASLIDLFQ